MRGRIFLLLAAVLLAAPAFAEDPAECRVAADLAISDFALQQVPQALRAKQLGILVLGAGSSTLPGPDGEKYAYPARLRESLAAKLPGVAVKLTTDVKAKRTAAEMVAAMPAALAAAKPSLVVWQTGTVDAMRAVDPDQFSAALAHGIDIAHAAGADVILVNSQYSPRTETLIALGTYEEDMRWVAVQHEIPLSAGLWKRLPINRVDDARYGMLMSSKMFRDSPGADQAVAGTGSNGFLYLHSLFGHCATGPAFSHFSIR